MILELAIDDETYLRSLALTDTLELFALVDANRSHLRPWLFWVDLTESAEDTGVFIRTSLDQAAKNRGPVCGVFHLGAIAGVCGFRPIDERNRSGELGYWLAESATGRGLMTGCVRKLVTWAFDELPLDRIEIRVATGNASSRAIPERLDFTYEGILREAERIGEQCFDVVVYSMLRREWDVGAR